MGFFVCFGLCIFIFIFKVLGLGFFFLVFWVYKLLGCVCGILIKV
jgi:hypothetical protein